MFTAPKVECFMQNAGLTGKKDEKQVWFTFYVTPIRHVLATEISPEIAKELFHQDSSGTYQPVSVMSKCSFNIGKIPMQRMELHASDDPRMDKEGVMLDRAEISELGALRLFADKMDHTLEFTVTVPKDELSMDMMSKYFKEKLYISFEAMQATLPSGICNWCDDKGVAEDKSSFACQKHVKKLKTAEIKWISKEAEKAAAAEK